MIFKMEGKNEIVISSYNCRGINEKNHDYLNNIFKNCDFLFLQETWLYKFQHNILDNILSHVSIMLYLLWMMQILPAGEGRMGGVQLYGNKV